MQDDVKDKAKEKAKEAADTIADGGRSIGKDVEAAGESVYELVQDVLSFKLGLGDFEVTVGALIASLTLLAALWFAAAFTRRWFDHYAKTREAARRAALYTVSRLVYYLLITIAFMVALSVLGIPVSKFAIFAGALGVGLGFGLQAIFSNFISGLILLFDRSLKVGDFVELESGVHGEVRDINIRATLITTNDNIDILVPNSEFVAGRVVNWTHGDVSRRVRVPFGVAYGIDKERVKKAALEAAGEVPFTLAMEGPRGPKVWLTSFGDSSLNFELVVWLTAEATKRPSAVTAAYTWALETALSKYCIEIPFPQRDLNIRTLFGLDKEAALRLLGYQPESAPPSQQAEALPPELTDTEREELARNDAQEEVEQTLEEEELRKIERAEANAREAERKAALEAEAEQEENADEAPDAEAGAPPSAAQDDKA